MLAEPALTNIGIVLPEPGFHDALRELTRRTGTLLVIDETHTFSAGPGGYTAAHGLEPDLLTIGKAIGGGVPVGAFGVTEELARRALAQEEADYEDVGGVGGTLAGNALSLAAVRATLGEVLTEEAFARMIALGERLADGVAAAIAAAGLPWHVTRLGCRAEYRFSPQPAAERRRVGGRGRRGAGALPPPVRAQPRRPDHALPQHGARLAARRREADVDRHTEVFADALGELGMSRAGRPARDVVKRFDDVVAVDGISLEIPSGSFFALLGPSGCGKTTTLRMIGGFEEPDEGAIYLGDRDVVGLPPYKRDVNTVFQSYALFPHLSIFENVAFGLRRKGVDKTQVKRPRRRRCCDWSGSRASARAGRASSRAASSSASRSRARS